MAEKNIEETLDKIVKEVDDVKGFLLEAKSSIKFENYDDAKHFLNKAEQVSTCSYCKNKLLKFSADVDHVKSLCHLKDEGCPDDKDMLITEIDKFYNKLPDISEIRRQKLLHPEEDPMKAIWEGLMAPVTFVGDSWNALMKSVFEQK